MKRLALLGAAAIVYMAAAWMVAPGFYDGFGPPQPYNFTCPPPQAGANGKPLSGHADVKVIGGVSDADSVFTEDGQLVVLLLPGAFAAGNKASISVDIKPLATCPEPAGIRFVTNVYQVTASAPLTSGTDKLPSLEVRYSNLQPDPSTVYQASDPNGTWTAISSQPGQPYVILGKPTGLGYFAAGYPSASPPPGSPTIGGGQLLPIIVAVLIIAVVLAGLPLAIMRRRRGEADD